MRAAMAKERRGPSTPLQMVLALALVLLLLLLLLMVVVVVVVVLPAHPPPPALAILQAPLLVQALMLEPAMPERVK